MFSVLYVDDEAALLEVGKLFLEESGAISLDTAESAKDAIEKLDAGSYDGIISDYMMPRMDGITFLKYIRAHFGDLPFILFTGKGREEVVIEALNSGADYYLQKGGEPIAQYVELEHKIILAIQRRQTTVSLQESQKQLAEINARLEEELAERTSIEAALRESEKRLQGIVHGSPIPQFVIDRDHRVISWNEALESYSGVPAEDIVGTTDIWKAFYAEARPVLADLLVDGNIDQIATMYPGKSGKSKYVEGAFEATDFFPRMGPAGTWLYFTAAAIRDPAGTIIGAVETLEDITDIKETEAALTASRNYLDKIINTIADPVFVKDRKHCWVLVNDALCRFMGHIREELIGRSDYEFFPKEQADIFWEKDEAVFASGRENINEEQFTDASGTVHTIVTKKTLYTDIAGASCIVGVIRDITDQKKAEDDLRAANEKMSAAQVMLREQLLELQRSRDSLHDSEARYRAVFENTGTATVLLSEDTVIALANEEFERLSGYRKEEINGKMKWTEFVVREDLERMLAQHRQRRMNGETALRHYEFRFVTRTGDIRNIWLTIDLIPTTKQSVASLMDITARVRAEDALRTSEQKLRALLDQTFQFIGVMTPDGVLIDANRTALEFAGIRVADVIGKPFWETPWWTHSAKLQEELRSAIQKAAGGEFVRFEATHPAADGTMHVIDFSLKPVKDENGAVIYLIPEGRDITGWTREITVPGNE